MLNRSNACVVLTTALTTAAMFVLLATGTAQAAADPAVQAIADLVSVTNYHDYHLAVETGELFFDVGEGIAVVGIGSAVMYPGAVDAGSIFGAPIQSNATTLAYFNTAGLPTGEDSVGLVLPAGLSQEELTFSYTPTSGPTQKADVMIVPEPSTIAMLAVLGLIGVCWRRRRA